MSRVNKIITCLKWFDEGPDKMYRDFTSSDIMPHVCFITIRTNDFHLLFTYTTHFFELSKYHWIIFELFGFFCVMNAHFFQSCKNIFLSFYTHIGWKYTSNFKLFHWRNIVIEETTNFTEIRKQSLSISQLKSTNRLLSGHSTNEVLSAFQYDHISHCKQKHIHNKNTIVQ